MALVVEGIREGPQKAGAVGQTRQHIMEAVIDGPVEGHNHHRAKQDCIGGNGGNPNILREGQCSQPPQAQACAHPRHQQRPQIRAPQHQASPKPAPQPQPQNHPTEGQGTGERLVTQHGVEQLGGELGLEPEAGVEGVILGDRAVGSQYLPLDAGGRGSHQDNAIADLRWI